MSHSLDVLSDEAVFITVLCSVELSPLLTDKVVFKVGLICIIFLHKLAGEVLDLQIGEAGLQVDDARHHTVD